MVTDDAHTAKSDSTAGSYPARRPLLLHGPSHHTPRCYAITRRRRAYLTALQACSAASRARGQLLIGRSTRLTPCRALHDRPALKSTTRIRRRGGDVRQDPRRRSGLRSDRRRDYMIPGSKGSTSSTPSAGHPQERRQSRPPIPRHAVRPRRRLTIPYLGTTGIGYNKAKVAKTPDSERPVDERHWARYPCSTTPETAFPPRC